MQAARLQADMDRLEADAAAAVRQGRDDLATQALGRKAEETAQLADLQKQIDGLKAEEDKMTDNERRLSLKIQTFRTQKEVIKAQYSSAEAQVKIGEATTGISEEMTDVGLALDRAKDKTERMKARASAIDDLTESGALEDSLEPGGSSGLDRELAKTRQSDQVAADLARLKAQVGSQGGTST